MNWIWKRLFCARNHKKDGAIFRLIFPSLLGIVLCGICLAGTTWAWYSASTQSSVAAFQSAQYGMEVTVTAQTGNATQIRTDCFTLDANGSYTVTLRATGNASVGYGQILLSGGTYCTQPVIPGDTFTFTVHTGTQPEELTVIPAWGSQSSGVTIANGAVLGTIVPQPTETEPIQPTETEPVQPVETEPVQPTETEPVQSVETGPVQSTQPEPVQPTQPTAG